MHRVLFMSFSESASIFFNSNALHTGGLLVTLQHKLWLSVFSGHHFKRNIKHPIPGLAHNKTISMQWTVELWGKPRVEMSGCCKRCHPMQRVSNFGHLFSPIRNNWVKRNVDLLGMFFCCFFSHAFRLLHVPTSRFDYSACTVIDRTITSRKTAAN